MTRTEWYPPSTHPVRVGLYETSNDPTEYHVLDYWNGEQWCDWHKRPYIDGFRLFWRGLTEKVK